MNARAHYRKNRAGCLVEQHGVVSPDATHTHTHTHTQIPCYLHNLRCETVGMSNNPKVDALSRNLKSYSGPKVIVGLISSLLFSLLPCPVLQEVGI